MTFTKDEFFNTVRAKHPHKWIVSDVDAPTGYVYWFALDTAGETQLDLYGKWKHASHIWFEKSGNITYDSDGIFNPPVNSLNNIAPSNNPFLSLNRSYVEEALAGVIILKPNPWSKPKCCCGAHSVGSNRHSSWCDIERNS